MDGLFQGSAQVDGPLLDDLPDVFYPVLFVLDTRSLREQRQSVKSHVAVNGGHIALWENDTT